MAVDYFASAEFKNLAWRVEVRSHSHLLNVLSGERSVIIGKVVWIGDNLGYGDELFIEVLDKLVVFTLVATFSGHWLKLGMNAFSFI